MPGPTNKCAMRVTMVFIGLLFAFAFGPDASASERQHVIVVVGAAGEVRYAEVFAQWAELWKSAAERGDTELTLVGTESNETDCRQRVLNALKHAAETQAEEAVWLVLIGHGTFDGRSAGFNLQGPDLYAPDIAQALAESKRPIAVINCASCSAPFINELSGPDRIVMTGTKDGSELQFAHFGGFLAEAIGTLDADIDRDGQTSLLEAWLFAASRTEQFYEADGRLATEHSLLDDNGDHKGTRSEVFEGTRVRSNVKQRNTMDGQQARRWHLVRSEAERSLTAEQRAVRDRLEADLEVLRDRKSELTEEAYLQQLQEILLPLASLYERADQP
ncbi:MAG: hypothetical protein R3C49_08035 [Planctomycetaceae bacterium]